MTERSNAMLATSSFDRIPATAILGSTQAGFQQAIQPTTSFRVQTAGANLIQGAINRVSIASVMFPYATPTIVQNKNDTFQAVLVKFVDGAFNNQYPAEIFVPQGFYTGAELATAVQTAINDTYAGDGLTPGIFTVGLDSTTRAIVIQNTQTWSNVGVQWALEIFASNITQSRSAFSRPNLLWTMGFRNYFASHPYDNIPLVAVLGTAIVPYNFPTSSPPVGFQAKYYWTALVGSMYLGTYTNFVDIVSPALCRNQYVRDGTTAQGPTRRDVICRLYIANDINTYQENPTGTRPFVIHRYFPNGTQKVMNWTTNTSIDYIDLELYDMYGDPLPNVDNLVVPTALPTVPGVFVSQIGSGLPDYSLTFHCHEHDVNMEPNVGYRY